jgi:Domain of unknown function (DUF932)
MVAPQKRIGKMSILTKASNQWASRPSDQRFLDLPSMQRHFEEVRVASREAVVPSRRLEVVPEGGDSKGLVVRGPNGHGYAPTHWAFGQLATLAEAPAGYLRSLPAPIAADCINYGLQFKRDVSDVGVLLQRPVAPPASDSNVIDVDFTPVAGDASGDAPPAPIVRAVTGPRYGRVWNAEVVAALRERFGDGRTGLFRVPGEFGKQVAVTKRNTTLYASDRDFFVFLADEEHRIEVPNRRGGKPGSLARGFFVWNSEVGAQTLGVSTFLFDYVCSNRIVWGAEQVRELRIRHSVSAPVRFIEEVAPALEHYAQGSTASITEALEKARSARLVGEDLDKFLAARFSRQMGASLRRTHELEEDRPIESIWDVATALTAKARDVEWQDERVQMERQAGDILKLAA